MTIIDPISDAIANFNFMVFGLLFLIYLGINSQLFFDKVLMKFDGTIDLGIPTNYGTMIQALIMALMAVLVFSLYQHEII